MAWVTPSPRILGDLIEAADWNQDIVDNTLFIYSRLPQRVTLWHHEDTILSGTSPFSINMQAGQAYGFATEQNPASINDEFQQSFFIKEGSYGLVMLGRTTAASGQVTWYLDDVAIATNQDWYSASATDNVMKSVSVTITGSGRHILRGKITGKNASSSGYRLQITKIFFVPAFGTEATEY